MTDLAFTDEQILRMTELALRQYSVTPDGPKPVCRDLIFSGMIDGQVVYGVIETNLFSGEVVA